MDNAADSRGRVQIIGFQSYDNNAGNSMTDKAGPSDWRYRELSLSIESESNPLKAPTTEALHQLLQLQRVFLKEEETIFSRFRPALSLDNVGSNSDNFLASSAVHAVYLKALVELLDRSLAPLSQAVRDHAELTEHRIKYLEEENHRLEKELSKLQEGKALE